MTTWAQATHDGSNPWDAAHGGSGTGDSLTGQGALTDAERQQLKTNLARYEGEQGKALSEQTGGHFTKVNDKMDSSARIYQSYFAFSGGDEEREAYIKEAQKQSLGDVNDPSQRLKTLSALTQDTGQDSPDGGTAGNQSCAGASIVGAAYLAEGPAGLTKVISAIEKFDPEKLTSANFASDEYLALKEKLKKDPSGKSLTMKDLQALQQTATSVLNSNDPENLKNVPGVHNSTMDRFLDSDGSKDLKGLLSNNNMEIEYIDNDGKAKGGARTADHYVLKIKGQEGHGDMIYDSVARRGGQIIDCAGGVEHYNRATMDTIGDAYHPYAT